jgi:hypothetical protein
LARINEEHRSKQELPIEVTDFGIIRTFKDEHWLKQLKPTFTIDFGILICFIFLQSSKQQSSSIVAVSGIEINSIVLLLMMNFES